MTKKKGEGRRGGRILSIEVVFAYHNHLAYPLVKASILGARKSCCRIAVTNNFAVFCSVMPNLIEME